MSDRYQEFADRLKTMSDQELIDALNREVGNPSWTSSRASYLAALHKDLDRRAIDYSAIGSSISLSLDKKVNLVDNKLIPE